MSRRLQALAGEAGPVEIERDSAGVVHISAADLPDLHFGLGFCHALDRGLQMLLVRILGRGQAGEQLSGADASLALDRFFRRMHFDRDVARETAALPARTRVVVDAYCHGINRCFEERGIPWELRLLRCGFTPWTAADVLLTAKVIGYVPLGQAQANTEHFLLECVQNGIPRAQLEELFPGQLTGID